MVVFELPATRDGGAARAVSLGSCRVRNPLFVLRDRGLLRVLAEGPTPTHTAEEAAQALDVFMGETCLPDELNRFVFESDHRPALAGLARTLNQGADVFMLEISDDKQFSFHDVRLNQNFVSRHFVQPYRGALLDWYREISRGKPAQEATVESSLEKLKAGGYPHDGAMAELLRGIRLERRETTDTAATLAALTAKMGGRWVIVGPFAIPGDEGDVMRRRRLFSEGLKQAAHDCGASFFDPSVLLAEHGVERALDGGVSIYEYAEAFYPTLGKALIEQLRAVGPPARAAAPPAPVSAPAPAPVSVAADAEAVIATPPTPPPPPPPPVARAELGNSAGAIWLEAQATNLSRGPRKWLRRLGRGLRKLAPKPPAQT